MVLGPDIAHNFQGKQENQEWKAKQKMALVEITQGKETQNMNGEIDEKVQLFGGWFCFTRQQTSFYVFKQDCFPQL